MFIYIHTHIHSTRMIFDFVSITIWDKVPTPSYLWQEVVVSNQKSRYRCYIPETTKEFMVKTGRIRQQMGVSQNYCRNGGFLEWWYFKSSQFEYWTPWWLGDPHLRNHHNGEFFTSQHHLLCWWYLGDCRFGYGSNLEPKSEVVDIAKSVHWV